MLANQGGVHIRGDLHEQAYLDHLEEAGYEIVRIQGSGLEEKQAKETLAAMVSGAAIISQGVLSDGRWGGRADILRRTDTPSGLGDWSYEVIDTKLARETKGGSVLQLCLYTDLVAKAQGLVPEFMYVVAPWSGFEPQTFRLNDYLVSARKPSNVLKNKWKAPDRWCEDRGWLSGLIFLG